MRTTGLEPVSLPGSTDTPAALATSKSATFLTCDSSTRLDTSPTPPIAFPSSTRRCWPVAVVTISLSTMTAASVVKFTSFV
jgi:hypothetical protein